MRPTLSIRRLFSAAGVIVLTVLLFGGCGGAMAPGAPEPSGAPGAAPAAGPPAFFGGSGPEPPPPPGIAAEASAAIAAEEESAPDAEKPGGSRQKGEELKPAKTWKRSQLVPNASRLMVGDREELPLRGMQAKVTIDGFRARVLVDCHFVNDRAVIYEGTFQLRLPEEASPYFYAFGESVVAIAGNAPPPFFGAQEARRMGVEPARIMAERSSTWRGPREARMVPNEKAAFAYGEVVRRRVDPALLEWSGAGVFSARVFPLAPNRLHRIVVGYDVDLVKVGDELEYRFDLPEVSPSTVVDLSVASPAGTTVRVDPQVQAVPDGGRTYYRLDQPKTRTLTVRVKPPRGAWIAGNDSKTGAYFGAAFAPGLPVEAAAPASQAVFLVDTSLSSNPDRFNVWLKLMRAVLDKNRDALKKFAVLFFDVDAAWWKTQLVDNTPANVDALVAFANQLSLEGATDIGAALAEAMKPSWLGANDAGRWDVFLLSDGAATWGESDLYAISKTLRPGKALFAYQTGLAGTDVGALSHLARESGGAVFSVVSESEVDKAATAHRARPWQIEKLEIRGVSDVLLAGRPKSVFPGQTLRVVGRGVPAQGAEVELTLERGGAKQVVKTPLDKAPIASDLAPRLYGQVAVRQLEDLGAATEGVSKAYATHFRVTGKTCSLLMLETEEDYRRFNIKPDDDALVIKSRPAKAAVETTLAAIAGTLGDPKAAFLTWLQKMKKMPGVDLEVPPSLETILQGLPADAFRVDAPPLRAQIRQKKAIPPDVLAQLASHKLEYDTLTGEADRRLKAGGPGDALRALSSLVEEQPGDGVLARDVGFSAMEWGQHGQAFHLFRRVAVARPFEPQTYRAMARSLIAMNKIDLAMAYYEIGLHGRWHGRFGEFRKIIAMDYLNLLRRVEAGRVKASLVDYARSRLGTLSKEFGVAKADLVVMITWNTDNTDVDLHVVEPTGEECFYNHPATRIGGRITQDVTQGYGPEMYMLGGAPAGRYVVRAHYFAADRNRASARTKVHATIVEGWGTPNEKVTEKVVVLETGRQDHEIATIVRGAPTQAVAR